MFVSLSRAGFVVGLTTKNSTAISKETQSNPRPDAARSVEMMLLSIIPHHTNPSRTHTRPQRPHEQAETWSRWHKGAHHGLPSISPEDRADRNALPKRPQTRAYIIVSELLQRQEIIDADRYRYVTYIRRYAENVAVERSWCRPQTLMW